MSFNTISKIGSNIVPSQKSQKRFAARLRKLRWEIYHEEKSKVNILLEKYKTLIGEFLNKYVSDTFLSDTRELIRDVCLKKTSVFRCASIS